MMVDFWKAPTNTRISPTNPLVPGKPKGRQSHHAPEEHEGRQILAKTHVVLDIATVAAFVDRADHHKECTRDDTVVQASGRARPLRRVG